MIKQLWKNYKRYISISKRESILAVVFGIIGAFSETFSIYLLAKLLTSIEKNKNILNIKIIKLNSTNKVFTIVFFLISGLLAAILYFYSNKNIVEAKCNIERFVRKR